jgi:dimethylamine monooxygenase subunit A
MTDSFWRDPPWRGGKSGYRMGLRPIDRAAWLPDRIDDAESARKRGLLDDPASGVFAELDGSRVGQQKVFDAVSQALGGAPSTSADTSPLVMASLRVPDDLCLMERDDDAYRLTAACVCAPSYWRLAEKIGRPLDGIHGPVPTLNDKLAASMAQFFTRLPQGAIFERRNWLMHTNPALYQPHSEAWHDVTSDTVERLVVRSERQTLHRLDADTVMFTIRVTCHPLTEIVGHPEAARDLLTAIHGLDAAERSAKGYRYFAPAVSDYLRSVI